MSGQLAAGIITDREIGGSASNPVKAFKLQHLYKVTERFGHHLGPLTTKQQLATRAKVGATAGWTVGAADDLPYMATLAASQTGSTLIVPLDGLPIGSLITGFKIHAQIESAGGAVTLDADLRAVTNVAAEPTDASLDTMTQVSVTADTAVAQENLLPTAEVVTSGKSYYLKLTGTTAAATDIILLHCEVYLADAPVTKTVVLFTADKAGKITDVGAGLDDTGTSTAISFDIKIRGGTSLLAATIDLTHADSDRTEESGTISGTGAYAAGDVIEAVMTVTTAVGASGPWLRYTRQEDGD